MPPTSSTYINPADLIALRRRLEGLEKKIANQIARKATRRACKVHLQPQMKRATPKGPTGRLRKSIVVRSLKRSRIGPGSQAISKNLKRKGSGLMAVYYGNFQQWGRTFNMFLPDRLWKLVPSSWKGKGKRLWKPGNPSWRRVADRRGAIAIRSAIRLMNQLIDIHVRNQPP